MNHEVKNALQSKTVWGAGMALVATAAKIAGYDIGDPELYVNDAVTMVGTIFAIYGRVAATSRIRVL